MKKTTRSIKFGSILFAGLVLMVTMNACSSEYHWVKVKSADPNLLVKEDIAQSPVHQEIAKVAFDTKTQELLSTPVVSQSPVFDHGKVSNTLNIIHRKAEEIVKTLSAERMAALHSSNESIRTQAVKETLHEQLMKNASFAKLSQKKQDKLENKISARISKLSSRNGEEIWGVNKLIIYGLALWVIGVLFLFVFWPLALLIDLAGTILIILGLIEQFS